jgi:hypothetical protein
MKRIHIRNPEFVGDGMPPGLDQFDPSWKYDQTKGLIKPRGLWWSCGLAWEEWCADNQPEWLTEDRWEIILPDHLNIKRFSSMTEWLVFEKEYGKESSFSNPESLMYFADWYFADWPRVAEHFDGLEWPTYDRSECFTSPFSFSVAWSAIDVPSGVVWNLEGVKVKPLDRSYYRRAKRRCLEP